MWRSSALKMGMHDVRPGTGTRLHLGVCGCSQHREPVMCGWISSSRTSSPKVFRCPEQPRPKSSGPCPEYQFELLYAHVPPVHGRLMSLPSAGYELHPTVQSPDDPGWGPISDPLTARSTGVIATNPANVFAIYACCSVPGNRRTSDWRADLAPGRSFADGHMKYMKGDKPASGPQIWGHYGL